MNKKPAKRFQRGYAILKKMGREQLMLDQKAIYPEMYEMSVAHLFGDVWARPGLSLRDRQLVTLAANIALAHANHGRVWRSGASAANDSCIRPLPAALASSRCRQDVISSSLSLTSACMMSASGQMAPRPVCGLPMPEAALPRTK